MISCKFAVDCWLYFLAFTERFSNNRSSHQWCSVKKGVVKNFIKFIGKHLCQSLFFNKVASLRPATLLEKRLWHRCFPVNFVKFLRTPPDECFWISLLSPFCRVKGPGEIGIIMTLWIGLHKLANKFLE